MPGRVIALNGQCQRSGDCCLRAGALEMMPAERERLLARRPDLSGRFVEEAGVVALLPIEGRRCPLLAMTPGGLATCTVHDIRPLNCRRFWCGRPDPSREPYEDDVRPIAVMGCRNLTDRVLDSRPFRREMAQRQRKAMRAWGLKHGWRDDVSRPPE